MTKKVTMSKCSKQVTEERYHLLSVPNVAYRMMVSQTCKYLAVLPKVFLQILKKVFNIIVERNLAIIQVKQKIRSNS